MCFFIHLITHYFELKYSNLYFNIFMSNSQLLQNLNIICSFDGETQKRGLDCLISTSVIQPEIILSSLNEIKLLLTTLCITNNPRFGSISSILLALSNSVNSLSDQIKEEHICHLISISQVVAYSFLHTTPDDYAFGPQLFLYVNSLLQLFQGIHNSKRLTLTVFLKIIEHCKSGFAPYASLLPILTTNFQTVISLLITCNTVYYPKIAEPLELSDMNVVYFFVALWTAAMHDISEKPSAIQALLAHSKTIATLSSMKITSILLSDSSLTTKIDSSIIKTNSNTKPDSSDFSEPCKFLLLCCHALKSQRSDIKQKSMEFMPVLIETMERQQAQTLNALKELMKEEEEAKTQKIYMVHRTTAEVTQKKGRQLKWKQFDLILADEAKILLWTTSKSLLKDGSALHMSDLLETKIVPKNTKDIDRVNVIRINTQKGNEYLISFKNEKEAKQWQTMIHELMNELLAESSY